MHPTVSFLGHDIQTYWLAALCGIAVCSIVAFLRHKKYEELQQVDITNAAALLFVGVIIGGRLLSILTTIPIIVKNWDRVAGDSSLLYQLFSNGMVFYGGLIGAIVVLSIYVKKYGLDKALFFDFFTPLFPLFHAFGRIGCFLTGCCHGFESERCGIAYEHSISSANGIPYFPIQLVSSVCELALFTFILAYEKRHFKEGKLMRAYLLVYAIGRFVIEFFRGDAIRGIYFGLSTSQWISIGIIIYLTITYYEKNKSAQE